MPASLTGLDRDKVMVRHFLMNATLGIMSSVFDGHRRVAMAPKQMSLNKAAALNKSFEEEGGRYKWVPYTDRIDMNSHGPIGLTQKDLSHYGYNVYLIVKCFGEHQTPMEIVGQFPTEIPVDSVVQDMVNSGQWRLDYAVMVWNGQHWVSAKVSVPMGSPQLVS